MTEDNTPRKKTNRPKNNRAGRPSKMMDDKIFHQLIELIGAGNYVQVACSAVGISEAAYYRAMAYGRDMEAKIIDDYEDSEDIFELIDDEELHAASNRLGPSLYSVQDCRMIQFRRAAIKATAMGEVTAVLQVRKAGDAHWQAAMAFLERRFPQRWRKRVEISSHEEQEGASGIDETILLSDPKAVELIHEALEHVAGELTAGDDTRIDLDERDVIEVDAPSLDDDGDARIM
jgi:transposase